MTETPRRRFRALLAVSLAINLFVVGIAGGAVWRWYRADDGAPARAVSGFGIPPMIRRLPPERREEIMAVMQPRLQTMRAARGEARRARRAALTILKADDFDPEAFEIALEEMGARSATAGDALRALIADLAMTFTPEERRDMAEAFEKRMDRRRGNRRNADGD